LRALAIAAALALAACGSKPAPEAAAPQPIPAAIARFLSANAIALGGLDFRRLRALGLENQLTGSGLPFAGSLPGATELVAAWDGSSMGAVARGHFATPPPGAKLIPPDLAVFGPATPSTLPVRTELLDRAQSLASGAALWAVTRGSAVPELPGNAVNVTRLLKNATWVTVTLRGDSSLQLDLTAECPGDDEARRVEETARASITLAAAAARKQPAAAAMLRAIQIGRTGAIARLHLTIQPDGIATLRKLLH
jgi:hypothetical protein